MGAPHIARLRAPCHPERGERSHDPSFDHTIYIELQTVIVKSLTRKEFGVRGNSMVGGVRSQNSRPRFSGPIAASRMTARKTKHSTDAIVAA